MLEIRSDVQSVTAFAPATCANLAVGYDILGCALEGIGDTIRLERRDDDQLVVAEITGIVESDSLPYEASRNTATAVIQKILSDYQLSAGFTVYLHKGIPLGSGLGGSAASTVAALVAFNGFLASPLSLDELGRYALFGEEVATGVGHGDNICPALEGGLLLIQGIDPIKTVSLPVPDCQMVVVCPDVVVKTRDARAVLPTSWPLEDYVRQSAHLAGVIAALYREDVSLLRDNMQDILIAPHRTAAVPGFDGVQAAALEAGALACSLSGSGPTVFAMVERGEQAVLIEKEMVGAFSDAGVSAVSWVSSISTQGAMVMEDSTCAT